MSHAVAHSAVAALWSISAASWARAGYAAMKAPKERVVRWIALLMFGVSLWSVLIPLP